MQGILLVSNSPDSRNKAGFVVFHPERNNLVPKFCPLTSFAWKCITHISDFGLIYVPPKSKRKLNLNSGHIYVIGGYDNIKKKFLKSILRYDSLRGEWFHCKKMNVRRACFTPFLSDGKIFCAGGYVSKTAITDVVEWYEPVMDMVQVTESLPTPCCGYGCAYLRSKIFLIGGNIQLRTGVIVASSHFWSFESEEVLVPGDPSTTEIVSKFINIESARVPVDSGIIGHSIVICENNNRIYIVGGTNKKSEKESSMAGLYYTDIDSIMKSRKETNKKEVIWNKRFIPEMQRSYHGVALLSNKIFTIGGLQNKFNSTVPIMEVDEEQNSDRDQQSTSVNLDVLDEIAVSFLKGKKKKSDILFVPVNETIGYFDWKRKIYNSLYSLRSKEDINLENVHCVVVDMNEKYAEFNKDRYDWLLQWPLW